MVNIVRWFIDFLVCYFRSFKADAMLAVEKNSLVCRERKRRVFFDDGTHWILWCLPSHIGFSWWGCLVFIFVVIFVLKTLLKMVRYCVFMCVCLFLPKWIHFGRIRSEHQRYIFLLNSTKLRVIFFFIILRVFPALLLLFFS